MPTLTLYLAYLTFRVVSVLCEQHGLKLCFFNKLLSTLLQPRQNALVISKIKFRSTLQFDHFESIGGKKHYFSHKRILKTCHVKALQKRPSHGVGHKSNNGSCSTCFILFYKCHVFIKKLKFAVMAQHALQTYFCTHVQTHAEFKSTNRYFSRVSADRR